MDMYFERLKHVRELNKKNIQKKAFIDLLKYMRENGMRTNFQLDIQPLLLDAEIQDDKYFYKAYETFVMLKASSQLDDQSDLKNVDVLRL